MRTRPTVLSALMFTSLIGCARSAAVQTDSALPLQRVVIYRNGVGYFERRGVVERDNVEFRVRQREVGDFLATLSVMESGGSSVRSAAFPMPAEANGDRPRPANERRRVRLELDGARHDLSVGYMTETPIWRPSYRLVFTANGAQVQAWGIVQNLSGEDWRNVRLSLVSGAPVTFRSELAEAMVSPRPLVTDRGEVIDNVPRGDTTLAQEAPPPPPAAPTTTSMTAPTTPEGETEEQYGDEVVAERGGSGRASGGRRSRMGANRGPMAAAPTGGLDDLRGQAIAQAQTQLGRGEYYRRANQNIPSGVSPSAPRSVASLAAVARQGGSTRYDLPVAVTIPDQSATMVMLAVRDVPGQRMYLFAPDPGVGESSVHPFQVARFENRTGAMLERGPLAIFEQGAFLGQGMLDPLPDGASATVPFSLERALTVESNNTSAVEGARLLRINREQITIERYNVSRTTYRVRNGRDEDTRVVVRHALSPETTLFEPPQGTEQANGAALVPVLTPRRGRAESLVTTRSPYATTLAWTDPLVVEAVEGFLRTGNPPAALATQLRTALDLRREYMEFSTQRNDLQQRRDDLQTNAQETRENLEAIRRNPRAADLRTQLTTRLATLARQIDDLTSRIVTLDTQISERRVRLNEAVRTLTWDSSATASTNSTNSSSTPAATP